MDKGGDYSDYFRRGYSVLIYRLGFILMFCRSSCSFTSSGTSLHWSFRILAGYLHPGGGGGEGDSTLVRRVCATGVLNLPPCSGVEKPKNYTLFWSKQNHVLHCIVLYCILSYGIVSYAVIWYRIISYRIVSYCIVLETNTIFMLYLFNQMILPFCFSSAMFVQKSFEFSITAIILSYDKCSAFQN